MCAIGGIYSKSAVHNAAILKQMMNLVRHRGPDDEGYLIVNTSIGMEYRLGGLDSKSKYETIQNFHSAGNLFFGHRRLAILDTTAAGAQPMSDREKKYWIVYNGEIYNYLELKEELHRDGYVFQTGTDTEVILASYQKWGEECVFHFNGMWAFAIYDKEKESIFCSRDRFGVKPLYYFQNEQMFVFFSEIKQATAFPERARNLNKNRAVDFLKYGIFDHTAETLFSDVFQLRGGHNLVYEFSKGTFDIKKWYCCENAELSKQSSVFSAAKNFHDIFHDSINIRLRSDVKVGSCLSGGLDSSSIVCVVNNLLGEKRVHDNQETVSSCFDEILYDERFYIDQVVRQTNVASYRVFPNFDNLFLELDRLIWHQDEPFASTSVFAQWNVFRCAQENKLTVMLDGQGADELFAGYHSFYGPYFLNLSLRGSAWILFKEIRYFCKLHHYGFRDFIFQLGNSLCSGPIKKILRNILQLNSEWVIDNEHNESDYLCLRNFLNIREMSLHLLLYASIPMLLHYEDRNSMAFSVESRLPFLDYRLVEFALSLPDNYKIHNGKTKYILREAMKTVLPEKIYNRTDKMGFVTPEELWLKENQEVFRRELKEAVQLSGGLINERILNRFEDVCTGKRKFDFSIWRVISFGRWLKVFNVKP